MYKLLRILLMVSILLAGGLVALPLVFLHPAFAVALVIFLFVLASRNRFQSSGAHGTARWCSTDDLERAGMLNGNGLILGTVPDNSTKLDGAKAIFTPRLDDEPAVKRGLTCWQRKKPRHVVRLNNAVHTAIFAPSGAGKNVSIIEPWLLTCPESAVVIDLKGENARLTAAHRAKAFGHQTVILDPYKQITDSPASMNVLFGIDPGAPESFEQIRAISEALLPKDPNDRDPHWVERGRAFVAGGIAALLHLCPPAHRNLQGLAEMMANKTYLANAIAGLKKCAAHDGLVARMGHEMSVSSEKELDGILSTISRSTSFLASPAVVASTTSTSFDLADLGSNQPVTAYLVLPMHLLRSQSSLMRLWLTALLRTVVSRGAGKSAPVNFICDEIAQLGQLEVLSDMLTIGRGYSIKITAIFQSMSQLKQILPPGQEGVLLSNTTQVFFAVSDNETAKYVSERLGDETIVAWSGGTNTGWSEQGGEKGGKTRSYSGGASDNWSQIARRLLKPEEVCALDPRVALTFVPGMPPVATRLMRFFEPEFKAKRGMSMLRAIIETTALFATVTALAAFAAMTFLIK